jgi:two-component system sensor histidine kinase KdpD
MTAFRSALKAPENASMTRWLSCAAMVAVVTGVIELLKPHVPVLSLGVLYLLAVLTAATLWGLWYAVAVSVASMIAFNFFFLSPLYTLTIQDSRNWFALVVFLVTAVVVSQLAARSRRRAEEAESALRSLQDLTKERERLAQEAVEAEALRRSDAIKTAILRTVSHDLRSPLMAILTSASALVRPDLALDEADRRELLGTVLDGANRLDHLVANLLDLSRLQAGAAEPDLQMVAVDDLVVEALEDHDSARIEVSLPDEPPAVRVDAQQVQRVLANLLENALKYSPDDEPVSVRVAATSSEVLVRVIDRGPGLAPGEAARIFTPFQRGRGGGEAVRGAGLGLAIAQGFAEANGGRVWVESHRGQGATFVLALPVAHVAVTA